VPLDAATLTAQCVVSTLVVGVHPITATYSGDANFAGSSGSLDQTVTLFPTTTALVVDNNNPSVGQTVNFTATVTDVAIGPGLTTSGTGTVDFVDTTDAVTICAAVPIVAGAANTATAACAKSWAALGGHAVIAVYSGDVSYATSTSPVANATVGLKV